MTKVFKNTNTLHVCITILQIHFNDNYFESKPMSAFVISCCIK